MKIDHLEIKNFNFIGLNSDSKGDLVFYGKTYFFGKHVGNLTQQDDNELSLHEESEIVGNITSDIIHIYGNIKGDIRANKVLNAYSGAVVEGDIFAKNFNIHPGAIIKGNINSLSD